MKIRFQADADFNAEIIDGLIRREPTIDFQTADEANLRGLKDDKVLLISLQANRILVSHDRKTMPKHFADFILLNDSPGVFIIAQNVPIGLAIPRPDRGFAIIRCAVAGFSSRFIFTGDL